MEKNRSEKMIYILNGISVGMFKCFPVSIKIDKTNIEEIVSTIENNLYDSVIVRKSIAQEVSNLLDISINIVNKKINIVDGDIVYIARGTGTIYEKEDLVIPSTKKIEFFKVTLI